MKQIERVQTGLRLEKGMLKVLKGLAEYMDISVAELVEGMVLHAFEGKAAPFPQETLTKIAQLKQVYDMGFGASDAHKMHESIEREARS
ncbi:MAG: hypothetical protein AB8B82_06000 [Roseovarius sp.]